MLFPSCPWYGVAANIDRAAMIEANNRTGLAVSRNRLAEFEKRQAVRVQEGRGCWYRAWDAGPVVSAMWSTAQPTRDVI
jgi:hypothetical protein